MKIILIWLCRFFQENKLAKKVRKDQFGKWREIKKESLGSALERVIEKEKLIVKKANKDQTGLEARWIEIVGKDLSELTRLKTSKIGNLTIEAMNSVVLQEINMMSATFILDAFKVGYPSYAFKKIIFKMKP